MAGPSLNRSGPVVTPHFNAAAGSLHNPNSVGTGFGLEDRAILNLIGSNGMENWLDVDGQGTLGRPDNSVNGSQPPAKM